MRKKASKRNNEKCTVCCGTGRISVRKDSGIKDSPYIIMEQRCQICNGKGVITNE